ncbi:MAG: type II toxin-antitoxin system VapC family toxin [Verrucomicrobiales bacterium]|nr:type II toxin-antitoxin system VapC family toxin [Verrucomicrobiales bacterium]
MIFDTDIFIWAQNGSDSVADAIDAESDRSVSVITYIEFIQGAKDKVQLGLNQSFFSDLNFQIIPLTPQVGIIASELIEKYALSHSMRMADALIAATAIETGEVLATGNDKHYRQITELQLNIIRP